MHGSPDVPLLSYVLQLLQGDPKTLTGQMGYEIPSERSRSALGLPSSWTCLENL